MSNRKVVYVVLPCVRVLFETLVAQRSRNPAVNTGLSTKKVVNVSHCPRRPLRKGWPARYIGSNCQVSPAQRKVGQSSGWPVGQLTASKSQVDWKQEWRWWRGECISNKPKHCKPAVVKGQWVVKVVNCRPDKCFRLKRRSVSCKWPSVEAKNKQMKWWAISVRSNHFSWHWA